jgi:hypothetical protein
MRMPSDDDIIARAVEAAALLIPTPAVQALKRPEDRLRLPLQAVLEARGDVARVDLWYKPPLPKWPSVPKTPLREYDVSFARTGANAISAVCELKWCQRGGIDALDEVMWDAFKLAHANGTLRTSPHAYLVYAATEKAWAKSAARFRELFLAPADLDVRRWIDQHLSIYRWNIRHSSRSRPKAHPRRLHTRPVDSDASVILPTGRWLVRIAVVSGEWEEPIPLDEKAEPLPPRRHSWAP